jgi:hypothetical protein
LTLQFSGDSIMTKTIGMYALMATLLTLGACGSPTPPPAPAATGLSPPAPTAEQQRAAENALAARESELAAHEAELAKREADLKAAAAPPASKSASKPVPAKIASKPAVQRPAGESKPAVHAPPRLATVPAGTQLSLALTSAISTKSAKVGDNLRARLTSDVMVEGRVVIPAGSTVTGQVASVVSGSSKVGGTPSLALRFERIELADGQRLGITGDVVEKGRSDNLRDTAKIVGGAAAGAIIGKQVGGNGDGGKVIGGLLGGAIGAVAAKKTGTEVELAEDTALNISLTAPIEVQVR